jgi:hypothetical protein
MTAAETVHPFVLVGDEREYWRRRAAGLLGEPAPPNHPVLTGHPELTRSALEAWGAPVLDARPSRPTVAVEAVGAELAAATADGDVQRTEALERRLRDGRVVRGSAWVVGVGRAAPLGLVRALADGRPFLAVEHLRDGRLAALGARARSVHVVAAKVEPADAIALQRTLDERAREEVLPGLPACPVGYLHGRDLELMTLLDAKQRRAACVRPAPGVDVLVDVTLSRAPAHPPADLVVVPYQEVSRETIAGHDRVRLLALTSHGMTDLVHLNGDYVCGRSRFVDALGPGTDRLPSCMDEGGRCFLKPEGRPLRADEIPAEHVFLNSCGSMRFAEADFGPRFNVWYTALEGSARSLVGTTRMKDGHGLEGLLYRQLVAAGFSLGRAVSLLNRAIASNQLEATGDVYLLVGDPEDRLPGTAPPAEGARLGGGAMAVRPDWTLLTVDAPHLVRALREGHLLVTAGARTPVFSSAVPTRDGAAFHLFLYGYATAPQPVPVDVRSFERERERLREAQRAVEENLGPALGLHRLYPDTVRQGGRRNLENRLMNVGRLLRGRFTDPDAARRLRAACGALREDLDRADADVATALERTMRRGRYRLAEAYQDTFLLCDDRVGSRCHICGDAVVHRTFEHVLRSTVRRVERVCRTCGSIEDGPDEPLALRVLMDRAQARGRAATAVLRLENGADRDLTGHCLAAVRRGLPLPVEIVEPVRRVAVAPCSTVDVAFEVRLGERLPTHLYDLQVGFVSATRIFVAKRPFWVVAG